MLAHIGGHDAICWFALGKLLQQQRSIDGLARMIVAPGVLGAQLRITLTPGINRQRLLQRGQGNFPEIIRLAGELQARTQARSDFDVSLRVNPQNLIDILPDGALGRVYLLYPDPWPKARHRDRRFAGPGNLAALARVMAPGAELRLATDIADYVATGEAFGKAGDETNWNGGNLVTLPDGKLMIVYLRDQAGKTELVSEQLDCKVEK